MSKKKKKRKVFGCLLKEPLQFSPVKIWNPSNVLQYSGLSDLANTVTFMICRCLPVPLSRGGYSGQWSINDAVG